MNHCNLDQAEQRRRKEIAERTRKMALAQLPVEAQDETSLTAGYRDYYLQISFSELHPLMVFCLARAWKAPVSARQLQLVNELNLRSILGSHAVNQEVGCYSYRPRIGWMGSWMSGVFMKSWIGAWMRQTGALAV